MDHLGTSAFLLSLLVLGTALTCGLVALAWTRLRRWRVEVGSSHYARGWFPLDRTRRAMWWIRLQATWWHTLLRRPFRADFHAQCNTWYGGYWKRGIGLSCERNACSFPFPFHSELGPRLLMLASPHIRSGHFTALDPLAHPWRARTEASHRTGDRS